MASRPLMLLALKQWGSNELAASTAIVFLMTSLAMSVSGFDTHRIFYQTYFNDSRVRGTRYSYRTYLDTIALQILITGPILAFFVGVWFGDFLLALLVSVYFASERLADESQRFLIFAGHRHEWGRCILIKAILQLAGVLSAVLLLHSKATYLIMACLVGANLVAYGTKISWYNMTWHRKAWLTALYSCLNQRLFWILSVINTLISNLDRVVVMLFMPSNMAEYTILVSCMSIVQNFIEYFFLSFRRRDILQGHLTLKGVFHNKRIYLILGAGATLGFIASIAMLWLYHAGQIDHIELIPIVLLTQLSLAITLILREIIYWNHRVQLLLMLEITFVVCSISAAGLIHLNNRSHEMMLATVSVLFTLRMGLMTWVISRAHNKLPAT